MKDKPYILIFTGNGKGKTTAALGMVLRASGHALRSLVVQFIKLDGVAGEQQALKELAGVDVLITGLGFVSSVKSSTREKHVLAAQHGWQLLKERSAEEHYDIIVLDEILGAVHQGLIDLASVCHWLDKRPESEVIVLTGRNAPPELIERADTVSEIIAIKHAYANGYAARKGVEF